MDFASSEVGIKVIGIILGLVVVSCSHIRHPERLPSGTIETKNLTLLNYNDEAFRLHESSKYKAVVLFSYGVGCPIARLLIGDMNRLEKAYPNVLFKYIYSNFDSRERNKIAVKKEVSEFKITSDVLLDNSMTFAKELGITRTCEALLIETRNFSVIYRGMVSDKVSYGGQKEVGKYYLEDAIKSYLKGRPIEVKQTEPKGCALYFPELSLDYQKKIAPIVINNCISCHNDRGAAPFSFNGLASLRKWSAMSQEVIATKRMPPRLNFFHGMELKDPRLGGLSSEDEAHLLGFLQASNLAKLEEPKTDTLKVAHDRLVARQMKWPRGNPDLVIELPEFTIPEKGLAPRGDSMIDLSDYRLGDRWVERVHVQTNNPKVFHHRYIWSEVKNPNVQSKSFGFEQKTEWKNSPLIQELISQKKFDWESPLGLLFKKRPVLKPSINFQAIGYMVSANAQLEPFEGIDQAYFLPGDSILYSGGHYKTIGRAEKDKVKLGIYFKKGNKAPKRLIKFITVQHDNFLVRSGEKRRITSYFVTDKDYLLHSINTHGHYRLRSQTITITTPAKEVYKSVVPLFNYHSIFYADLKTPLRLPAGTLIVSESEIDNTITNETNPNWMRDAKFGFEQWDEMIWSVLKVSYPNEALLASTAQ